jgi:hypothetical protein
LKNGRDSERERGGDWEAWSVLRAKKRNPIPPGRAEGFEEAKKKELEVA